MSSKNPCAVVIKPNGKFKVRGSYMTVFTPRIPKANQGKPDAKPMFGCTIIVNKKDKLNIEAIEAAEQAAKELGKTTKAGWKGRIPKQLKTQWHDCDELDDCPEEKKGCMYLVCNAQADRRPAIVDEDFEEILDPNAFKSGDYFKFSVNFYPYDQGSNGVGCGLTHVMFLEEGEALGGGRMSAEEAFGDEDDAPVKKKKKPVVEEDEDDDLGF